MDFQSLADLGEIIGGIAVVVSLVYLSMQVRQNTTSQQTENYNSALTRFSAQQSILGKDGELAMMFSKGVRDASVLTVQEKIQFTWILYEIFGSFEFMFHAAQSKSMPAEVWHRWSLTIAYWLRFAGVLEWWNVRPTPFTDSFTSYVESMIADNPVTSDANSRWQNFISGNQARTSS